MSRKLPLVVLVGRPNVGKSTLFNRITRTRRAIVTPVAGTTRDLIEQSTTWHGTDFMLLDTGGMFGATDDPLIAMVAAKGQEAIGTADLLVFVADGQSRTGPGRPRDRRSPSRLEYADPRRSQQDGRPQGS